MLFRSPDGAKLLLGRNRKAMQKMQFLQRQAIVFRGFEGIASFRKTFVYTLMFSLIPPCAYCMWNNSIA